MTTEVDNLHGYDFVSTEQEAMPHRGKKTEDMNLTYILASHLGVFSRKWDADLCSIMQNWRSLHRSLHLHKGVIFVGQDTGEEGCLGSLHGGSTKWEMNWKREEQYHVTPPRESWLQAESSMGKVPEGAPMKDWSSGSDGRYLTGTPQALTLEMSEKTTVYKKRLYPE